MRFILTICVFGIFVSYGVICRSSENSYDNKNYSLEEVASIRGLSEGPFWDVRTQKLYFVQIWKQHVCSYNPATGRVFHAFIKNGPVTIVVTVEDSPDKLLVTSGTDIVLVTWDGESNDENPEIEVLINGIEKGKQGYRFNDGKVDARGRFWAGTLCQLNYTCIPKAGNLYLVDEELHTERKIPSVSISNGLDWDRENKIFYYIDTMTNQVVAYDFDIASANISNKRVVIDIKEKGIEGHPDGMTIDNNGNLWVAVVHGSKLLNVDAKNGEILREIDFPVKMVTSAAFGGPNLDILYVTTATYDFPDKIVDKNGGPIFALKNLGVNGFPPYLVKWQK